MKFYRELWAIMSVESVSLELCRVRAMLLCAVFFVQAISACSRRLCAIIAPVLSTICEKIPFGLSRSSSWGQPNSYVCNGIRDEALSRDFSYEIQHTTIRPASMMMILSLSMTVCKRWAIVITVQSANLVRIVFWIRASVLKQKTLGVSGARLPF